MKKNVTVEIISALLLVFYVHSVISNYVQLQSLKNMLAFYTVHTSMVAWVIVLVEFVIAVLLFIPRTKSVGLLISSVFVITIAVVIFRSPHYPHAFGGLLNHINDQQRLILGILMLIAGVIALLLKRKEVKSKRLNKSDAAITVFS
jgi:hypothetical protein